MLSRLSLPHLLLHHRQYLLNIPFGILALDAADAPPALTALIKPDYLRFLELLQEYHANFISQSVDPLNWKLTKRNGFHDP